MFIAGMANSSYIHMDDTGMKHKGINHHLHVICNFLFSVFFIELRKDSETIKKILGLLDDETLEKILLSDDARQYLELLSGMLYSPIILFGNYAQLIKSSCIRK